MSAECRVKYTWHSALGTHHSSLGFEMPTRGARFAGMSVALVTPFRDGAVDYADLDRLVDWHVEQGTDGLVPCGTTGESPTLDHAENDRVIAAVCERAAGR